jgi:hypothetical protein
VANWEIQIVELILDKHDAPVSVKTATAAVEAFNKKKWPNDMGHMVMERG